MLIQAPIPRTRFAITPTNVRPIHFCLDMTPTRQFSNHNTILNLTQRVDDKLPIRTIVENKHLQSIIIKQDNINRNHNNSFCQNQSNMEMQNQIQELTKQKENMSQILQSILQLLFFIHIHHLYQKPLEKAIFSKNSQINFKVIKHNKQTNFKLIQTNFNKKLLNQLISYEQFNFIFTIEDLIVENTQLQESYQNQQFYIEQLEYQEDDKFNVTQKFGYM